MAFSARNASNATARNSHAKENSARKESHANESNANNSGKERNNAKESYAKNAKEDDKGSNGSKDNNTSTTDDDAKTRRRVEWLYRPRKLNRSRVTTSKYALPGVEPINIIGTDMMTFLRRDAASQLNSDNRAALFDRNSGTRVFAGSILKVRYETCKTTHSEQTFTGDKPRFTAHRQISSLL